MSLKFISLYGVVVVLTSLFFHFVPTPNMLSWEELLLSKLLNQAPALLCLGYLWFHRGRVRRMYIFLLLIAFLSLNVFSELYYYIVSPDYLISVNIVSNFVIFAMLLILLMAQRTHFMNDVVSARNISYAGFAVIVFLVGFGISLPEIYDKYFTQNTVFFYILVAAMLLTTTVVCASFFVDKTLSRNWYKLVAGTIAIALLDVYVYISVFVLDTSPYFIYTGGKVIFSIGMLLIVDRSMSKCLHKKIPATTVSTTSKLI